MEFSRNSVTLTTNLLCRTARESEPSSSWILLKVIDRRQIIVKIIRFYKFSEKNSLL